MVILITYSGVLCVVCSSFLALRNQLGGFLGTHTGAKINFWSKTSKNRNQKSPYEFLYQKPWILNFNLAILRQNLDFLTRKFKYFMDFAN